MFFESVKVFTLPEGPRESLGRRWRDSVVSESAQQCQEFGADSSSGHDAILRHQLVRMEREGGSC